MHINSRSVTHLVVVAWLTLLSFAADAETKRQVVLEAEYIDASLDEAVKQYGSMDNYIREGLGISDQEVAVLRDQLLE